MEARRSQTLPPPLSSPATPTRGSLADGPGDPAAWAPSGSEGPGQAAAEPRGSCSGAPSRGPVTWRRRWLFLQLLLLLPVRRSAPGGRGGGSDSPSSPRRRAEPGPSPPPSAPPPPSPLSQDMVTAGPRATPGAGGGGRGAESRHGGGGDTGGEGERGGGGGLGSSGLLMAAVRGPGAKKTPRQAAQRQGQTPPLVAVSLAPRPPAAQPMVGRLFPGAEGGPRKGDVTPAPGPDCEAAARAGPRVPPPVRRPVGWGCGTSATCGARREATARRARGTGTQPGRPGGRSCGCPAPSERSRLLLQPTSKSTPKSHQVNYLVTDSASLFLIQLQALDKTPGKINVYLG